MQKLNRHTIVTKRQLKEALRACLTVKDVERVRVLARPVQSYPSQSFNQYSWQKKISRRFRDLEIAAA